MVETYEVEVDTLSGASITITLDSGENSVAILKSEIEKIYGTSQHLQELFVTGNHLDVSADSRTDETKHGALDFGDVIDQPCTVVMCIKTETSKTVCVDCISS